MNQTMAHPSPDELDENLVYEIRPELLEETPLATSSRPSSLASTIAAVLGASIMVLTLCFGGVHPRPYYFFLCGLFSLCAVVSYVNPGFIASFCRTENRFPSLRGAFFTLTALLGYLVAQGMAQSLTSIYHPILGKVTALVNQEAYRSSLIAYVAFLAFFSLAAWTLVTSSRTPRRLVKWLMVSGLVVSIVAITHWFYDNGKLFWLFEPDTIRLSDRARWPFINPNHLGHFLIPPLFLAAGIALDRAHRMRATSRSILHRRSNAQSDLLTSTRMQGHFFWFGGAMLTLLFGTVGILGSQSRSTWIATSLGIILFLILERVVRRNPSPEDLLLVEDEPTQRRDPEPHSRRTRRNSRASSKSGATSLPSFTKAMSICYQAGRPLTLVVATLLVVMFLNRQGMELVEGRIQYALIYSLDDVRWEFYKNSLALFYSNPFFGTGLGSWSSLFPQVISPLLSKINPVYLHSDPLQFLIEAGIVGAIPILGLFFFTILGSFSAAQRKVAFGDRIKMVAATSGLFALSIASLWDFPFRIPAIAFEFALVFAAALFYIDKCRLTMPPTLDE